MVSGAPSKPREHTVLTRAKSKKLPARLAPIAEHLKAPRSMEDLQRAMQACRACPLWRDATQAVPGEGNIARPMLALVGEQPGDQEDWAGLPFV